MNARTRFVAAILAFAMLGPARTQSEFRSGVFTAAPGAPHAAALTRLEIRGTQFTRANGTNFDWRGISAFRLLEMIVGGRASEAEAYLDWCSAAGLTVVRVLTMAKHLFELAPDHGRAALPRLLEMAEKRGLYVEVVVLADTAVVALDVDHHVREVGAIAAKHPNAIVEIANEPVHHTQTPRVREPAELERLARLIPDAVPVALGAPDGDEFPTADYATVHFPRDSGDGGWGHVTALASGVELLRKWGKPLVNDEPIGAGEQFDPGRRDTDPERFRAAALLSRMVGMGATFHYEDGLHARVPVGRQRACFDAWQEAWALLPAGQDFKFFVPGAQESPVQSVKGDFAGAYIAVRGDDAWLLVTRTRGEIDVTWSQGWRPASQEAWKASRWRSAARVR
jgi:hypothetical protein